MTKPGFNPRFELETSEKDKPLKLLASRLVDASRILTVPAESGTKTLLRNMAFGATITALEAYLWETADYWVSTDEDVVRAIITKLPDFKEQKVALKDILDRHDNLRTEVRGYLQNLVWHRWDKVGPLYQLGLGLTTMQSFSVFDTALATRHDIVHRSGHDKNRNPVEVDEQDVLDLGTTVLEFAKHIAAELDRVRLSSGARLPAPL